MAKIKTDPNFIFRYALKMGPILTLHTQLVVNERLNICSLLILDQFNSVYTSNNTNMIVDDISSLFSYHYINYDELLLVLFMNFLPPVLWDQIMFPLLDY